MMHVDESRMPDVRGLRSIGLLLCVATMICAGMAGALVTAEIAWRDGAIVHALAEDAASQRISE